MNYIDQDSERMLWELGAIMLFVPVLRIVVGIITILGIFDSIERINRK